MVKYPIIRHFLLAQLFAAHFFEPPSFIGAEEICGLTNDQASETSRVTQGHLSENWCLGQILSLLAQ
jgi:hypothetical protein